MPPEPDGKLASDGKLALIFPNRPHARAWLHGVSEPMAANPLNTSAILPLACLARYVPVRKLTATVPRTYPANMSEDTVAIMATLTQVEAVRTCI